MSRRSAAPRRGIGSPPGPELLGVITSHGPSRECYRSAQKSSGGTAKAPGFPTACPALSAERVRAACASAARASALLQRGVPGEGAEVVAVEGAAEVPPNNRWQAAAQRPKRALPRARQKPETTRAGGG